MDELNTISEKTPCEDILRDPNRGKLALAWRALLRHPFRFLKVSGPFLTAHHPFCSEYEGHTFTLRGRKWCIGCFFNSLSFFPAMVVFLILGFTNPTFFSRFYLFWGGVVGIVISLVFSAVGLTDNKKLKAISKLFLGAGFAAISFSMLLLGDNLFVQMDRKILSILLLYIPVITLLNAKRAWEIEKDCAACEYKMCWSQCPGFKDLLCKCVDEGFLIVQPKIDASMQSDDNDS